MYAPAMPEPYNMPFSSANASIWTTASSFLSVLAFFDLLWLRRFYSSRLPALDTVRSVSLIYTIGTFRSRIWILNFRSLFSRC